MHHLKAWRPSNEFRKQVKQHNNHGAFDQPSPASLKGSKPMKEALPVAIITVAQTTTAVTNLLADSSANPGVDLLAEGSVTLRRLSSTGSARDQRKPRDQQKLRDTSDYDPKASRSDREHPHGLHSQDQQEPSSHQESRDQLEDASSADYNRRLVPVVKAVEDKAQKPEKSHGKTRPVTEDEARRHIQGIRDEKMKSYRGGIAEDFKNALDVISNELYPNSADFLLEILQNADDNTYESSVAPKLWITYRDDTLRFDTNEIGFDRADVEGICGVGRSSKKEKAKATRAGERQTGEKGIGFKAVFKVADEVFIKSGYYSFKFADKYLPDGLESLLGRVTPAWTEFPAELREGCTSILLKLRQNIDHRKLAGEIMKLDAKSLMFLHKLKEVEIEAFEMPYSSDSTRVILRREAGSDSGTGLSSRVLKPDISSPYLLFSHPVLNLPPEKKRNGLTQSELVLALPHVTTADLAQTHKVYSFLPIRDYGFKFVLQADFVLVANRKEIDSSREWNKTLLAQLPSALLRFVTTLNASGLQYRWPLLFPIRDEGLSFFEGINAKVLDEFSGNAVIESIQGTFEAASKLWLVPRELADLPENDDAASVPMVPPALSLVTYASLGYTATSREGLTNLGVNVLSAREFLQDVDNLISKHPDQFCSMSKAWHSRLSSILDRLTTDHEKTIASLRFIPLRDGTLVALQDGPLLFPLEAAKKNLQIPDKIGQSVVHADAAEDPARRKLLLKLGVCASDEHQVCRLIVRGHASSSFAPETIERVILIQHAEFLHNSGWRAQGHGEYLWVVLEDGTTRRRSSHVYLDSTAPTSASQIFGRHRGRFPFLHLDYQATFRTLEHRRFLINDLRLDELPRIVNPDDTPSEFTLSEDFRFLMDNIPAIDVLQLIRTNWGHYRDWIVPRDAMRRLNNNAPIKGGPHERINAAIACIRVELPGGRYVRLDQTCLPRKDVLAAFGLADALAAGGESIPGATTIDGASNGPKLEVLSVSQPESFEWDMLEHFNVVVKVQVKDLVRRLQQLQQGNPTKKEVSVVYEWIETLVNKQKTHSALQGQFQEEKLVFLPNHSPPWVSLKDCVWEAPDALKKTPRLKDEYPDREWLFCKTLRVAAASLATAVAEATRITTDDPLPYIRELLQHIDSLSRKAAFPRTTLIPLRQCHILPIWTGMPGGDFDCLSSPAGTNRENEWYIADRPYLRDCFEGQIPLLAFDCPDLDKIKNLLEDLDCEGHRLSRLARNQKSGAKGPARFDDEYTAFVQKRAEYISCLVPKTKPDRVRLVTKLKGARVSQVPDITVVWKFNNRWGVTTQGRPESVDVMLDTETDVLKIYLKEGKALMGKPPMKLVKELKTLCGITEELSVHLFHILVSDDIQDIESNLAREGLLTGETGSLEDAGLKGDAEASTGGLTVSHGDVNPDVAATRDAADAFDTLTLADYFGKETDTSPASLTYHGDSMRYYGDDDRSATSAGDAGIGRGFVNPAQRGLAAFSDLKARLGHVSPRQAAESRRQRGRSNGVDPLRLEMPRTLLNDVLEDEESQFTAEIYVHDFLARTFPNDYAPEKHWTSKMRSRAGHKPFMAGSDPKISTFTLVDSSGRLKQFLERHRHRRVHSLAGNSRFHIQVVFSEGPANTPFEMAAAQVTKAETLSFTHSSSRRFHSEIYVLAFVFKLYSQPTIALFVDPWQLKRNGMLSLDTFSKFEGCFHATPPVLYAQRCDEPAPSPQFTPDAAGQGQEPQYYQYGHLRPHEIRLLQLDADPNPDAPLKGSIQHALVDDSAPFWAISYVWGQDMAGRRGPCLETPVGVIPLTLSLELALRALRQKGAVNVRLWADAICINQADGREKALQIRLIGRIFGKAQRVVAWLGSEYDGSHEAIETLLRIRRGARAFHAGDVDGVAATTAGWWGNVPDSGDRVWRDIDSLLKRHWFERAWVVQEVVLASRVVLMCGTRSELSWEELFEGLIACERALNGGASSGNSDAADFEPVKLLPHAGPAFALGLARYRMGRKQGHTAPNRKHSLLELLELFSHTRATKEVDKLFAMLGLAEDTASEMFSPDYDSPLGEVVCRYAEAFVASGQAMELLYRAGITKSYPFCSWIPRWTHGDFPQTISTWAAVGGEFQAGARVPPAAMLVKTGCLWVGGFTFDTIQRTHPIQMGSGWALHCAAALAEFRRLLSYYSDGYPTGETADELLLRLPIGNASRPHLETMADRLRSYRDVARAIGCGVGAAITTTTKEGINEGMVTENTATWPANLQSVVLGIGAGSGGSRDSLEQYRAMDRATRTALANYWCTAAAFANRLGGAVFCGTTQRYVGLVPAGTLAGDLICLFHGGKVPFVLRHVKDDVYWLIGEAYVHGIMHKQAEGSGPKDKGFILM